MKFYGAVGVASLDRAEVRLFALAFTSDSASERGPTVAFMHYVEGHFQIMESIPTPRVEMPSTREDLYVHKMHQYLGGCG